MVQQIFVYNVAESALILVSMTKEPSLESKPFFVSSKRDLFGARTDGGGGWLQRAPKFNGDRVSAKLTFVGAMKGIFEDTSLGMKVEKAGIKYFPSGKGNFEGGVSQGNKGGRASQHRNSRQIVGGG